jgi:hypothetical protein
MKVQQICFSSFSLLTSYAFIQMDLRGWDLLWSLPVCEGVTEDKSEVSSLGFDSELDFKLESNPKVDALCQHLIAFPVSNDAWNMFVASRAGDEVDPPSCQVLPAPRK